MPFDRLPDHCTTVADGGRLAAEDGRKAVLEVLEDM